MIKLPQVSIKHEMSGRAGKVGERSARCLFATLSNRRFKRFKRLVYLLLRRFSEIRSVDSTVKILVQLISLCYISSNKIEMRFMAIFSDTNSIIKSNQNFCEITLPPFRAEANVAKPWQVQPGVRGNLYLVATLKIGLKSEIWSSVQPAAVADLVLR